MKDYVKKKRYIGLLYSLISSILFFILLITNSYLGLNNKIMDRLYQKPKRTSDIIIIGIDDKSLEALGPQSTWTRDYYAKVLDNIRPKNPAVVGFDIIFTGDGVGDDELVSSVEAMDGKVICGSNLIFGDVFSSDTFTVSSKIKNVSKPFNNLKEATTIGFTNTLIDKEDNVVRKIRPVMSDGVNDYDSFSYAIYKKYCEVNNIEIKSYDNNSIYRINYSSIPGESYTVVSFSDVYNNIVPSDIEGAIVLIGAYCTGLQDMYYTPIKSGVQNYGVEIHANIIDCYLKDNLITEVPNYLISIIGLFIIFVFAYVIYKTKFYFAIISLIILSGALFGIQSLLSNSNLYFPINGIILSLIITFIVYIALKYGEELITRYKTVNVFKKYVAPQVVEKALKEANYKVNVSGERRHIAVLFVDIRGFTPLSESLEPEDVVTILDEYLTLTTKSIFAVGGTLDKFIGDATMAIFGAPFDLDDYLFKSIKAAWLIAKGSEEIDKMAMEKYGRHVSFGIGVNSGYAVCGNIGSDVRIDYTAIGDTVNTAARLEANAKAGEILISEVLYNEVKDRVNASYIGDLELKGKKELVRTYKVIDIKE